jgi:hypothetical protein
VTLNFVRSAFALIFCAASTLAAEQWSIEPATPLSTQVTAVVLPDGRYSRLALHEMGREAAHILKTSGISLQWQLGEPAQAVNGRLVIVKLLGRCDMDGPTALQMSGPLGWSHEANGVILPFSDLACDNIRGAVYGAAVAGHQYRGNVLLGRAMGRVLAHELYHVIANTTEHGGQGVAQPTLSARELTSGQLELRPADVATIQNYLRQGGVSARASEYDAQASLRDPAP